MVEERSVRFEERGNCGHDANGVLFEWIVSGWPEEICVEYRIGATERQRFYATTPASLDMLIKAIRSVSLFPGEIQYAVHRAAQWMVANQRASVKG